MVEITSRFLAQLAARGIRGDRPGEDSDVQSQLRALFDAARAAHPAIPLDEPAFADALAARVDGVGELAAIHAGDLHLAVACARGEPAAITAFDRGYGGELDAAIGRSPRLGVSKDEFRQLVRTRLFVGEPGKPARIASYSGEGPLKAWVRVTAARVVVDLSRAPEAREQHADDAILDRVASAHDPETEILRSAYGAHVNEAFREALARLSVRQRNLLRQRYLHNLNADKLAPAYAVHRATAFGWLEDARKALMANVRDALRARVPGSELESVVGILGSRLDVSVRGALGAAIEDE